MVSLVYWWMIGTIYVQNIVVRFNILPMGDISSKCVHMDGALLHVEAKFCYLGDTLCTGG